MKPFTQWGASPWKPKFGILPCLQLSICTIWLLCTNFQVLYLTEQPHKMDNIFCLYISHTFFLGKTQQKLHFIKIKALLPWKHLMGVFSEMSFCQRFSPLRVNFKWLYLVNYDIYSQNSFCCLISTLIWFIVN